LAQDSYPYVVQKRKDAYYQKVRELLKELKAQSNLYAAKTQARTNAY